MMSYLVFGAEKCELNLAQTFFCCITAEEYVLQEGKKKGGKSVSCLKFHGVQY